MVTKFAKLMQREKLSSRDIESICGVSRQTVHSWRTGRAAISIQYVVMLMAAFERLGAKTRVQDYVETRRAA